MGGRGRRSGAAPSRRQGLTPSHRRRQLSRTPRIHRLWGPTGGWTLGSLLWMPARTSSTGTDSPGTSDSLQHSERRRGRERARAGSQVRKARQWRRLARGAALLSYPFERSAPAPLPLRSTRRQSRGLHAPYRVRRRYWPLMLADHRGPSLKTIEEQSCVRAGDHAHYTGHPQDLHGPGVTRSRGLLPQLPRPPRHRRLVRPHWRTDRRPSGAADCAARPALRHSPETWR